MSASDSTTPPGSTSASSVRAVGVSVHLGGAQVLEDVDFQVGAADFVALQGGNGSGKSTLVRTMLGLQTPSSGMCELFGTPIGRFREWHRVGFVPQANRLAGGVPTSVEEAVASGLLGKRRPFTRLKPEDRAGIEEALETVQLADRRRQDVASLSGGQQQRVMIARALASKPELLVLDEPTAGVDLEHQYKLADCLTMCSNAGVSVVLVAHELGPLRGLVRRSVVLRAGRVVHDGAPLHEHRALGLSGVDLGEDHHHPEPTAPRRGFGLEQDLGERDHR